MGKPRSVFNRDLDTDRNLAKQYAQNRQNITGMSSTFRGMPVNTPQVSGGQTDRVGQDTLKIKTMYLNSLRVDSITRVDLATVSGGAGITSTVASGQYLDFKVGATSLLNIGPTNVTFKNTVLAPSIDFGTVSSRIGKIWGTDIDINGDLTVDNDITLGIGGSETIDINAKFTSDLKINGQDIILDVDGDSKIYSSVDDVIKIETFGALRMEINNTGVGIPNSLQVDGDVTLTNSTADTITINTQIDMGGNDLDFTTGGTVDFHDIDTSSHSSGGSPALPAQPTAYFVVKYQGATRYIPYYS